MLITSLENDRIKSYIKLKDRKYRKKTKTFIVEGMHLVLEAYKKGIIKELILEKDAIYIVFSKKMRTFAVHFGQWR